MLLIIIMKSINKYNYLIKFFKKLGGIKKYGKNKMLVNMPENMFTQQYLDEKEKKKREFILKQKEKEIKLFDEQ